MDVERKPIRLKKTDVVVVGAPAPSGGAAMLPLDARRAQGRSRSKRARSSTAARIPSDEVLLAIRNGNGPQAQPGGPDLAAERRPARDPATRSSAR